MHKLYALRKTSGLGASKSSYRSVTPLGRPMIDVSGHATDHPSAKSSAMQTFFVSSVATTETLEGLYRANDGNDVLDDLGRKKPTANAISANGKIRLNQHFLGALNSLLREVDMRIVVQNDVLIIRQLQPASTDRYFRPNALPRIPAPDALRPATIRPMLAVLAAGSKHQSSAGAAACAGHGSIGLCSRQSQGDRVE